MFATDTGAAQLVTGDRQRVVEIGSTAFDDTRQSVEELFAGSPLVGAVERSRVALHQRR